MRWLIIAASLALAYAPTTPAGQSSAAGGSQTGAAASPSTSGQSKRPSHKHKHYSKRQPAQKAPTADRISEIQSALAREGYYHGDPNGKLDSNTVAALQKFQSANGLDASGKLDAPTLQKLGLGSDIAGVAAPKPVVPSCCTMAPSGSTSPGDKSAPSCCSISTGQQAQPAPSPQSADPAGNGAGAASPETKPAQK